MDKFNVCFIVLSLFIFGSGAVVENQDRLKIGRPVGGILPLPYQIELYDGTCLQYDRITKAVTGVPCDSYSNKQQFGHIPIEGPYNSLRHRSSQPASIPKTDLSKNSAFIEQHVSDQNNPTEENNTIIIKSLDFGQSGASRVALKFKSADVLTNVSGEISIKVGDAQKAQLPLQASTKSKSSDENVLIFDLKTAKGTHDVILSLPTELSINDLVSIVFKKQPDPDDKYNILSRELNKPLTVDYLSDKVCLRNLINGNKNSYYERQTFRFIEVNPEHWEIIEITTGNVLEAMDDPDYGYPLVKARRYDGSPNQIWYSEQNGTVLRSKFYDKCLTALDHGSDCTEVRLLECNDTSEWQTWTLSSVIP